MATVVEYRIRLPKYHALQDAFIRSKAKRKVVLAGRRGGKTTGCAALAVEQMLAGHRILEAAPTSDQTRVFWEACKRYLQEPIEAGEVYKNESDRVLEVVRTGARIRTKTAWDADSLRGDYADLLILDEYAEMDPSAWEVVGAPMLLDNDGDAVFIFTPKSRNHAFRMYQRAIADDTGRWEAWHFTSHDNPYLSETALAEITQDMTSDMYRQEVLAEFLENEGAVFRNIAPCLTAPETTPGDHAGHHLVMGVDWAKQSDFTCLSVVCRDCRTEVARDRFNQIDYHVQRQRLQALAERWNVAAILAESNSIGEPIIEELQRSGLPVRGFETTASSKPPLIESLALAFEREECRWQADPVWTGELEAYERRVSPSTGRSQYSAPEGMHDDTVIARALAWQACDRSPTGGIFV
jgi:hypothetical protein